MRLLRVHGLLLRQVRRSVPDHLTLPRFDVMAQLRRRPGGMTPGQLTRALLVTAGNVTGSWTAWCAMRALEGRGPGGAGS